MIYSMTGFGKAVANYKSKDIYVEIRSLNSKFMDMNLKCPLLYKEKEIEIRKHISENLIRGKTELSITVINKQGEDMIIDESLLISLHKNLNAIDINLKRSKKPGAGEGITLQSLINIPNVIKPPQETLKAAEWIVLFKTIKEATAKLIKFRKQEGVQLQKEILQRVKNISKLQKAIDKHLKKRSSQQRSKIIDSLDKLKSAEHDENRFEQEMIYYLEKLDITEELVRLSAHCEYFTEVTQSKEDVKGKKLGFITQEMGREINTLGSKANYTEIQKLVIQMKDELEKIKEQLSNIL
ncbi:MAG: YicC family protein [Chitinophagales bacterium]|nr:YicC family protein [Chitinophagales bacterium]